MRDTIFTIAIAIAVAVTACGSPPTPPDQPDDTPPTPVAASPARGAGVYVAEGCGLCHGDDRAGTEIGPPLTGLADHWQTENLAAFLRDPAPMLASDPRLQEMAPNFETEMPGVSEADDAGVRDLVAFLLQPPEPEPSE